MARIDRARLDAATFPVTLAVPTRYADIDVQGHVNNVAAAVILQEARVQFNTTAGLRMELGGLRVMVAAIAIEYAGEMHHPDPVEVGTGIVAMGRTSVTMAQVARQNGRTALYAETVLVLADADGPAPIPASLREAFERLMLA
jgi:acyl-CoA thioester hydrolase